MASMSHIRPLKFAKPGVFRSWREALIPALLGIVCWALLAFLVYGMIAL
jgi:hypothetical protein